MYLVLSMSTRKQPSHSAVPFYPPLPPSLSPSLFPSFSKSNEMWKITERNGAERGNSNKNTSVLATRTAQRGQSYGTKKKEGKTAAVAGSQSQPENALRQARCFVGSTASDYTGCISMACTWPLARARTRPKSMYVCMYVCMCVYVAHVCMREREREQIVHDRADIAPCDTYTLHLCLSMSLCLPVLGRIHVRFFVYYRTRSDTECARYRSWGFV